jgi:hypothetical protein
MIAVENRSGRSEVFFIGLPVAMEIGDRKPPDLTGGLFCGCGRLPTVEQ